MNVVASSYVKDDIEMAAEKVVKLSTEIWGKVSYSRDDISVIVVALNPPYKWCNLIDYLTLIALIMIFIFLFLSNIN